MANTTLNTRLCLKRDSYNNWETVKDTFVPLSGEPCIIVVQASTGAVAQEPAVLIKIGDGTTTLRDLPYTSALAADVYPWAKATTKPSYKAEEIEGLADYISGEIEDTNTQYKLEKDAEDEYKLIFSKKDISDEDYTMVFTVDLPHYDDTNLSTKINALEELIGTLPTTATATTVVDYIDEKVAAAVAAANHLKRTKVNSVDDIDLNAEDADQYIYMVPKTGKNGDKFDEYMIIDGALERVGDWAVDLDDYTKKVSDATAGNLAGLDSNGDLTDSGKKVGGDELSTNPDGDTLATEKAVATGLAEKANDSDLANIAKSGDVKDLKQTDGDYIILNCGTAITAI